MTRGKSSEMEFVLLNRFARVASSRTKTENVIFAKKESRNNQGANVDRGPRFSEGIKAKAPEFGT